MKVVAMKFLSVRLRFPSVRHIGVVLAMIMCATYVLAFFNMRREIYRVQFDFTYLKSADYTVFFAVWDSSSDLLLMGWGVQAHPVRLVDFLF